MNYTTLISAEHLATHLNDDNWIIFDCRFSLANESIGAENYRKSHIPNARYIHLNRDLSSHVTNLSGRHPLPNFTQLTSKLGQWGLSNQKQAVVYDDAGGAFSGRMWWLLRCLGHYHTAVLDGGIQAWKAFDLPITTALPSITPTDFRAYLNDKAWLTASQVRDTLAKNTIRLIDARTQERYLGKNEPIDPVAGHIPKAVNRPFQCNLDSQGLFLPADKLRQQFCEIIGEMPTEQTVHMCGSGVTACHNLLAMEHAGLCGSKLYAGSWSEWITNKNRAIATD